MLGAGCAPTDARGPTSAPHDPVEVAAPADTSDPEPVSSGVPDPRPATKTPPCGQNQFRMIDCRKGTTESVAEKVDGYDTCTVSRYDAGPSLMSNTVYGWEQKEPMLDEDRTARFRKETGQADACCYSRCESFGVDKATATAGAVGGRTELACLEENETAPSNPSAKNPMCPAGFVTPEQHSGSIYAALKDVRKSPQIGQKDMTLCCYEVPARPRPIRGRALNGPDGPCLASECDRADWATDAIHVADVQIPSDPAARRRLANEWASSGAEEHASVAAFAKLTLELLALGAPPELIRDAQQAGLDEVEHARVSYALASAFAGRPVGPGALRVEHTFSAVVDPCAVAVETLRDGCIGETLATLCARQAAADTPCHVVRAIQQRIAKDEQRHAELAWRVVAWLAANHVDVREQIAAVGETFDAARADPIERAAYTDIVHPALNALLDSSPLRPAPRTACG